MNDLPLSRTSRRSAALAVALVALAAAAAFPLSPRGDWVFDDIAFLPPGPSVTAVANPLVFFTRGAWAFANRPMDVPIYRPLLTVTLWALAPVLGTAPAAWHLPGLALHVVASTLVLLLLRRLLPASGWFAPIFGALLFAVHPVHTEAVAPSLGFGHTSSATFALLALHAQLTHARGRGPGWLAASALASLASMLSTEGALAVPILLVAVEWAERRARPPGRVLAACIAPVVIVLALRSNALGESVPLRFDAAGAWNALQFAAAYLRHLLLPWPQLLYTSVPCAGLAGPLDWGLAALAIALTVLLVARAPRAERWTVGFAVVLTYVPIAVPVAAAFNPTPFFAPRALYLPTVGLALLVAWGVSRIAPEPSLRAAGALAAIVAVGLLGCNVATLGWRDNVRVTERIVEADPERSAGHSDLAQLYLDRGDLARADREWSEAMRLASTRDDLLSALYGLAMSRASAGHLDDAERLLRAYVAEAPERTFGWIGLGNVAFARNELVLAREHYERAARLDPGSREAAANLEIVARAIAAGHARR